MPHEQYVRNKADEVLRNHGAAGSAAEVDALHSILNNINVQTKNNNNSSGQNFMGQSNYKSNMANQQKEGRLPPI